jgi:CheY-like chemotaxis protein
MMQKCITILKKEQYPLAFFGVLCYTAPMEYAAKTILAVDDAPVMLRTYQTTFSSVYTVLVAKTPETGLGLLAREKVDLILLDYEMPGPISGIDFLAKVRQQEHLKELPVVLVTSHVSEELVLQAKALGAAGFIKKPFNTVDLVRRVLTALRVDDMDVDSLGQLFPVVQV